MTRRRTPRYLVEASAQLRAADLAAVTGVAEGKVSVDWEGRSQLVELRRGGNRHILVLCPTCGRPRGALFLAPGSKQLDCRHCAGIAYLCQATNRSRRLRRLMKLYRRVSGDDLAVAAETLRVCSEVDEELGLTDPVRKAELERLRAQVEVLRAENEAQRAPRLPPNIDVSSGDTEG